MIVSRWDDTTGARRRKYYRLSEKGASQLARERVEWDAVDATMRALWSNAHA
jgi:DNA-binding PadR family transcriptional regulator